MATRQLLILKIDDSEFNVKPNSLTLKKGAGEATVRTQSSGSGVATVTSTNYETKKSMASFEMLNTPDNIDAKDNLLISREGHVLEFIYSDGGSDVMTGATLINDPDEDLSYEGGLELEFEGNPIVQGN